MQVIGGFAPDWGGPSTVLRGLCAELVRRGHEVEVVTTDVAPAGTHMDVPLGVTLPQPDGYGLRVHRCHHPRPPYPSVGLVRDVWARSRRFDVAHVHSVFNLPVTGSMAALRGRRVPYAVRTCGMLDGYGLSHRSRLKAGYYRLIERANLRGAARIHVSTPMERDEVARLALGVPTVVAPQGVEPGAAPSDRRPHARPYVLFLSRVAAKKNLPLLVDAFATLAAERPALDLVIAGPDEYGHRGEIEARVRDLGCADRVRFTGTVRGQEKATWLHHAELFALPSHDENFGVVVVEAASAGLPVVVSDQVGLAPAVRDHGAGVVVPRERAALEAAMRRLLDAGKAHYADGTRALAEAFSWARAAVAIEAMYTAMARP